MRWFQFNVGTSRFQICKLTVNDTYVQKHVKNDDLFKLEYLKAVFNEIIKAVSVMRGPLTGQTFLSYVPGRGL